MDVSDAIIYILGNTLSNHFYGTVGKVSNQAGEITAIGCIQSGETKSNALYAADKNYTFSSYTHRKPMLA